MILRQFFNRSLAQYAYLAGCPRSGQAVVIDPDRDVEKYIAAAASEGLRITSVTETHIHADYLSGSRELAERTGAHLYLPGQGGPDWQYGFKGGSGTTLLKDGDEIKCGGFKLVAWHTPGHTPEHTSFVLYDGSEVPLGAFTGDFVFVGDVGRPDLLEKAAGVAGTMEAGAKDLYASVQRFKELPDSLIIWPGHGAGSACGKSLGGVPVSTLGYERIQNWALTSPSEAAFSEEVLAGQPEPPKYFAMMKTLNRQGPAVLGREVSLVRSQKLEDLERELNDGTLVLDTRPSSEYGHGHPAKVLHIPLTNSFTTWAGWLVGYDQDVVILATDKESAHDAAERMSLIGLDRVSTWFGPDVVEAYGAKHGLVRTHEIKAAEVPAGAPLIDIRGSGEWRDGHLDHAKHIPMGYLTDRREDIPKAGPVYVHCASGGRSPIACSVLERMGIEAVDVCDGYAGFMAIREGAGV